MKTSDFAFELPEQLIAKYPTEQRTASRLLHLDGVTGALGHHAFTDMLQFVDAGDLLIFNNTRVIPARLLGQKSTGGKVEVLVERMLDDHRVLAHVRASKSPKPGATLLLENAIEATMLGRHDALFELSFAGEQTVLELLEAHGHMPLPPYIDRPDEDSDKERYQTVYNKKPGAVAAPTAGLHFTPTVFDQLTKKNHHWFEVTLHVGAGTFKPLDDGAVEKHEMHSEELLLSRDWLEHYLAHKGTRFAVGTTSLRTLESCHWMGVKILQELPLEDLGQFEAYSLDNSFSTEEAYSALLDYLKTHNIQSVALKTQLMIKPGYRIKSVKGIITNFHQPGSTLLLLVSAGIGQNWQDVYQHALQEDYRFLSYGDSSLLYFE